MNTSWINTANALQEFVNVLICGKCGFKPTSPVRFTSCGHFFCRDCIKSTIKCVICDVPVQPNDMNHDHIVDGLIQNCDVIAEVIDKRDLWNNTSDVFNQSVNTTVSKTIDISKKLPRIPKRNINKPNCKGETQLHTACLKRNAEHVKRLLLAGADPNTKDNAGWTPLQEMVCFGYIEICKLLLNGGALPDIPGHENRRPLHEAVDANRIEIAKLLLSHHADKDVYDQCGNKPIDLCRENKSEEMQKLLTDGHISQESLLSDFNQIFDKSFFAGSDKLVIFASNLKPENQKLLNLVATKYKFKISTTNSSSVTHVLVETNKQNVIKSTFDVLLAIIHGKWLLSSEWIALAADLEDVTSMDVELFEVNGAPILGVPKKARENKESQHPRLFNNCFFYFALQANTTYTIGEMQLKKQDLVKLVNEGEGVVLSREPDPEKLKYMPDLIPFHIANDESHPLYKCTHYVIYMPGKGEPRIKYKMSHIKTLPLIWLIECIEKFTLVNPADLGLS